MKKLLSLISILAFLFLGTSCSKPSFTPNPSKAAGVIIVNGQPEPADDGRICAELVDNQYVFTLDSAMVYYFDYDAETIYAGDRNLTSLVFAANIDTKDVGAVASAGYTLMEGKANTVYAYYLHFDGKGLFFKPDKAFATVVVGKDPVDIEGTDYRCRITLEDTVPAAFFTITCRNGEEELAFDTIRTEEMEDYMQYPLPAGTDNVEINSFNASSEFISRKTLAEGEYSYTAVYDIGGQFPGTKSLRLVWPQPAEE